MASKSILKANFAVECKHQAFYTGGKVQFSKEGQYMLCHCSEKVNVIDVSTGTTAHTYGQEEDGEVTCFILSPDDKILVVALRSLLLKQWDFETKEPMRSWKVIHTSPVSSMAFDATSTLLATGGADSTIKVWDVIQQYCTHNLRGHQGVISVVEFHPDTEKLQLFSAGDDYNIRVWDLRTSNCLAVLEGHYSVVTGLQFSRDHATLYTGGRDKVVNIWNLTEFKKSRTIPVYETVESVLLLPEGKNFPDMNTNKTPHFITAGDKGVLQVWNSESGQCVYTQKHSKSTDSSTASTEDLVLTGAMYCGTENQQIAVVSFDHNISLYNTEDLSLVKQFAGYNDEILDVKFLGSEESHIVVATNSPLIKVFNVSTWDVQILRGHKDIVLAIDVFKSGDMFASSSKDNTLRVWKMSKDYLIHCVAAAYGHTHEILTVAFSKLSASFLVSGSQDLTIKVWNLPSDLSSDGVLSLNAQATEKAHDKDINSVIVAPNDKLIATGSQDKTAKLWSVSGLKLLGVFRGHKRGVWSVQFSPVDQCLATSSSDGTVKMWALSDYSCVKTFEGHDAIVLKVQFITRGMQIVTSGSDGLMKLWTVKTSECVKTFDEHEDKVWALAINKNEDRIITGAADSNIIIWKDVTETEKEEQRAKQVDFILQEQELMNLLQQKKYVKALGLAIKLEQPFRALNIMKDILGEPNGAEDLSKTLAKLRSDQLDAVLRFSVQWNTNSKHCHVAQTVLSTIIKNTSPEELLQLSNAKSALAGLIPYTEKHYQRMNKLLQQAMFVDYTWHTMKLASDMPTEVSDDVVPTISQTSHLMEVDNTSDHEQSDSSDSESGSVIRSLAKQKKQSTSEFESVQSDSSDSDTPVLPSKLNLDSESLSSDYDDESSEHKVPPSGDITTKLQVSKLEKSSRNTSSPSPTSQGLRIPPTLEENCEESSDGNNSVTLLPGDSDSSNDSISYALLQRSKKKKTNLLEKATKNRELLATPGKKSEKVSRNKTPKNSEKRNQSQPPELNLSVSVSVSVKKTAESSSNLRVNQDLISSPDPLISDKENALTDRLEMDEQSEHSDADDERQVSHKKVTPKKPKQKKLSAPSTEPVKKRRSTLASTLKSKRRKSHAGTV